MLALVQACFGVPGSLLDVFPTRFTWSTGVQSFSEAQVGVMLARVNFHLILRMRWVAACATENVKAILRNIIFEEG